MGISSVSSRAFIALLVALAATVAFFELGRMDVSTANEGQRATPPAEMIRSGGYVVPTLNGAPYLAKPPLLYWAIAGVYRVTGVISEWTARVPGTLCFILLVLCVYLLFRGPSGEEPARWAALIALASPYLVERTRWASLDIPLTLTTFLTLMALYHAWRAEGAARRYAMAVLAGAALAAATMLKGPVPYLFVLGAFLAERFCSHEDASQALRHAARWTAVCVVLALVLLVVGLLVPPLHLRFPLPLILFIGGMLWLSTRGGSGLGRSLGPLVVALVLGVGLCVPWALAVLDRLGWDYISGLMHSEVIDRTHTATQINSGSPLYFVIALPFMLAPWGFLLPLHASRGLWRDSGPFHRFALLAGWISVGIFSLVAGKEYEYVLPAVPLLIGVTGYHIASFRGDALIGWPGVYIRRWGRAMSVLLPLIAVGLLVYTAVAEFHPLLLAEEAVLTLLALVLLYRGAAGTLLDRRALAMVVLVFAALLTRSFHYTGAASPKDVGRYCRAVMAAGYPIETGRVYPHFVFYAEYPVVGGSLDPREELPRVRAGLEGDAPYFYLAREKHLREFSDEDASLYAVFSGPGGNKDLVLIGNAAAAKVVDELGLAPVE